MTTSFYITKYSIIAKAINFINLNSTSNYNPYHGFNHVFTVFLFVARHIHLLESGKEKELLLAALFHDYNHSGGKFKDDTSNIYLAADGLTKFHELDSEGFDLSFAVDLIFATRYPYNIPDEKLTEEGHLLRDADLSYLFSPISVPMCLGGLRTELNLELEPFLKSQIGFIEGLKFRIPSIERKWNICKQDRLNEIKALIDAL